MAAWFYYDTSNGETQWNHPLDDVYKQKVIEARTASNIVKAATSSVTEQSVDLPRDSEGKEEKQVTPSIVLFGDNGVDIDEEEPIDNSEYKDLKLKTRIHLDVDENTEISVDTNEILEQSDKMMPLAPLGPIGNKKPLPPLQKLAPLGSIENAPLGPIEHKTLGAISRKSSTEKEKQILKKSPISGSAKIDTNGESEEDESEKTKVSSPKKTLKGLKLGMGKTFLKSDSIDSSDHRDNSEQNSVRSTGSQKGILKSQINENPENILRQAMMQREEKRIMFDLGANMEFATEVQIQLFE